MGGPITGKGKYNIIEEREDRPKEKVKDRRPRPIIDLDPEDDSDAEDDSPILGGAVGMSEKN